MHSCRLADICLGHSIGKVCSKCWNCFKNKLNLISFAPIPYGLGEDKTHYVQLSTFQSGDDTSDMVEKKQILEK